jgi:hypothetical protein
MEFKIKIEPKIKLKLNRNYTFNNVSYKEGHLFHVIGSDSIRGYDLEDDYGNQICEVRMIMDIFDEV